ncbi:MAG: helix-turn-helix transcriptional regulator [Brevirhabdus sp.]
MNRRVTIAAILVVQAICAVFFVSEIVLGVLGLRATPIKWQIRELMEIGAALGLILGLALGAVALVQAMKRTKRAEAKLKAASQAFSELLEERFQDWRLTPAERDVAMFAIKGMSTAEIAALRDTSEGTVKAQTNAIYRKAGVANRTQLVSLFVEDLME